MCDAELQAQDTGRPRLYCSSRCKHAAELWAAVERVIVDAEAAGDVDLVEERRDWLVRTRAKARDGWAGARADIDAVNARIRRRR